MSGYIFRTTSILIKIQRNSACASKFASFINHSFFVTCQIAKFSIKIDPDGVAPRSDCEGLFCWVDAQSLSENDLRSCDAA